MIAGIAASFLFALPSTQTLTIVNSAHVSSRYLARVEFVTIKQSERMRSYWHTPVARFGPGGWPVTLQRSPACVPACGGYHEVADGVPYAVINVSLRPWSLAFSHEILETLADPYGDGFEVCDPAWDSPTVIDGIVVARFVRPAYFLATPTTRKAASPSPRGQTRRLTS